jgi:hypothetical protein
MVKDFRKFYNELVEIEAGWLSPGLSLEVSDDKHRQNGHNRHIFRYRLRLLIMHNKTHRTKPAKVPVQKIAIKRKIRRAFGPVTATR